MWPGRSSGDPDAARTHDRLLRRQMLYPTELPDQVVDIPLRGRRCGAKLTLFYDMRKSPNGSPQAFEDGADLFVGVDTRWH